VVEPADDVVAVAPEEGAMAEVAGVCTTAARKTAASTPLAPVTSQRIGPF
jgi:hypothetical protein